MVLIPGTYYQGTMHTGRVTIMPEPVDLPPDGRNMKSQALAGGGRRTLVSQAIKIGPVNDIVGWV